MAVVLRCFKYSRSAQQFLFHCLALSNFHHFSKIVLVRKHWYCWIMNCTDYLNAKLDGPIISKQFWFWDYLKLKPVLVLYVLKMLGIGVVHTLLKTTEPLQFVLAVIHIWVNIISILTENCLSPVPKFCDSWEWSTTLGNSESVLGNKQNCYLLVRLKSQCS